MIPKKGSRNAKTLDWTKKYSYNKKNYKALSKWSEIPRITVVPVSTNNESILLISLLKLKELF